MKRLKFKCPDCDRPIYIDGYWNHVQTPRRTCKCGATWLVIVRPIRINRKGVEGLHHAEFTRLAMRRPA